MNYEDMYHKIRTALCYYKEARFKAIKVLDKYKNCEQTLGCKTQYPLIVKDTVTGQVHIFDLKEKGESNE